MMDETFSDKTFRWKVESCFILLLDCNRISALIIVDIKIWNDFFNESNENFLLCENEPEWP